MASILQIVFGAFLLALGIAHLVLFPKLPPTYDDGAFAVGWCLTIIGGVTMVSGVL